MEGRPFPCGKETGLAWKYGIIPNINHFHVSSVRKEDPQMGNSSRQLSLSFGSCFPGSGLEGTEILHDCRAWRLRGLGERRGRSPQEISRPIGM